MPRNAPSLHYGIRDSPRQPSNYYRNRSPTIYCCGLPFEPDICKTFVEGTDKWLPRSPVRKYCSRALFIYFFGWGFLVKSNIIKGNYKVLISERSLALCEISFISLIKACADLHERINSINLHRFCFYYKLNFLRRKYEHSCKLSTSSCEWSRFNRSDFQSILINSYFNRVWLNSISERSIDNAGRENTNVTTVSFSCQWK